MTHRNLMARRDAANASERDYMRAVHGAVDAIALGDDGHGNTITFGQLRGLHIHQPTLDPRDESRVEAVAVAKTETLLAIHHFAIVAGEGEDPLTTAKAQGKVEKALQGYSAALKEAEHSSSRPDAENLVPGINGGYPKPFDALAHRAGDICKAIRAVAKAHAPEEAIAL